MTVSTYLFFAGHRQLIGDERGMGIFAIKEPWQGPKLRLKDRESDVQLSNAVGVNRAGRRHSKTARFLWLPTLL